MYPVAPALAPMLAKLQLRLSFNDDDRAALLALPHMIRTRLANDFVVREGDEPSNCTVLLSGYAIRHKVAGNGGRQIFSINIRGDIVDLHTAILRRADHNVQAQTKLEVALIPVEAIRQIAAERPQIGRALWCDTMVDAAVFREWTLNVGRRDARARTAHLLCEFALRLQAARLGSKLQFELPMSQEQLGDALGLTSVHISRTLKALASEGLIKRHKRMVQVLDFEQLARVGDFDASYLYLNHSERRVA